ncbi:putative enzyme with alpha/beta-hydrolase domain; triacylglycerol lipase (Esterase) [Bradyrhizobium sp. STM 3809]|nr:putative enzyme with alpha/beta-hydrolase domain; triacylglycerol lipase (Esterase) [Bradyrhizobium sp. STM 3809]
MVSSMKTSSLAIGGDNVLSYIFVEEAPAIVIIHGVGGHKEDWIGVAQALSDTRRVFCVDMLGFGESSKCGDDLSMTVQSAAIKALLDAHNVAQADVVGNSVGGWVAATFAATYPERIRRLVLIDVAGFRAMFEGQPPVNFDPDNGDQMQQLIDITINPKIAKMPGLAQRAFDAYVASGEKAISATWGKSLFASPRLEDLMPKIGAPTLLLWGADDRLVPSALTDVFCRQIAGARMLLIPDAGHFPQIDQPDAVIAALNEFMD